MQRKSKLSPAMLFVIGIILSYLVVLFLNVVFDGAGTDNLLFPDRIDSGMDFFSSIQYTKGRDPYFKYNTIYPPLANLFFYFIYKVCPLSVESLIPDSYKAIIAARESSYDLRVHQVPFIAFLITFFAFVLLVYILLNKLFKGCRWGSAAAFCCVFSMGFLYALERGNIILLACLFTLFFVMYYNSGKAWLRELAFVSLALAAGLKIYPAVFGFLLVYQKQFKRAWRLLVYGVLSFILPVFAFGGIAALKQFVILVLEFSSKFNTSISELGLSDLGKVFIYRMQQILQMIFGNQALSLYLFQPQIEWVQKLSYVVCVCFILFAGLEEKLWRKLFYLVMAMTLVQQAGRYALCFFIIPLGFFFLEESELNRKNWFDFLILLLLTLPLPVIGFTRSRELSFSYGYKSFSLQAAILLMTVILFARGVRNLQAKISAGKPLHKFFRVACPVVSVLLAAAFFLPVAQSVILYSQCTNVHMSTDNIYAWYKITADNEFVEHYRAANNSDLLEVLVKLKTDNVKSDVDINLRIIDNSDSWVLYDSNFASSSDLNVQDEEYCPFIMNGVQLQQDHEYSFVVYSNAGTHSNSFTVGICADVDKTDSTYGNTLTTENGINFDIKLIETDL